MDLTIRLAAPNDAPMLSAVAQEAKGVWGYPRDWLEGWREELTIREGDLERLLVLVGEWRGAIVGFGATERQQDEWDLAHLWVRPAHARRGFGRRLLDALAREARSAGAGRLRILADPHAVAFYEGVGAVRVGEVPAPMPGSPERVLVAMELRLDS